MQAPYLSQHGVWQLADLLHVLCTDIQLTATDPQKGAIGELLAVQLHLDEVVLPCVGVLDTHLQHQLCREGPQRYLSINKDIVLFNKMMDMAEGESD